MKALEHPDVPFKLWSIGEEQEVPSDTIRKEASNNSCFQGIASDCAVVLSFLSSLESEIMGDPRRYCHLHWHAGLLGQMLYVEAHQLGLGATGMGCFLDDESSAAFQQPQFVPLYHFALGHQAPDHRFQAV